MIFNKLTGALSIKFSVLATLALGGCIATALPYMRAETAQRLAAPAWMLKRDIPASPFMLRAYERVHDRGGEANLYISGDGSVLTSPQEWENNPTPKNPVALHLASKDKADNVFYLARPCQYTGMMDKDAVCDPAHWKEGRFSKEVLRAMSLAMDEIALRYDIRGFNLIGYAGGANLAALLAAQRLDVKSLRTVAGVMDHAAQSDVLGTDVLSDSLNAADIAPSMINIAQYHFIGGQDEIVPPAVLHSYLQAMPVTKCVQTLLVQEAGHDEGWVSKWPELLAMPVTCGHKTSLPETYIPTILSPKNVPVATIREKPAKP